MLEVYRNAHAQIAAHTQDPEIVSANCAGALLFGLAKLNWSRLDETRLH